MNISSSRFPPPRRWFVRPGSLVAAALLAAAPSFAAPPPPPTPTPGGAPPSPAAPAAAPSPAVPAGQQQASAAELVTTMRRALGTIAKAQGAKASEAVFRTAKARAFAQALVGAVGRVEELGKAVQTPDAKTFGAMARTGSALAALQVTFRYNGIEDDDIEEGFEKLAAAYTVFQRNYGRDLVAARSEGESVISPAQRAGQDELQKQGAALTKSLLALQPAVKDAPAAAFEVAAMLKGLARLERPPRDRRGFLDHLTIAGLLLGRREGLGVYLNEVFREDAKKLDATQDGFRVFREAFETTLTAAFADEKPAELFAKPAVYVEDLGVAGVKDAELPALLASAGKAAQAPAAAKPDPAAARAADAQINADDPDDDTSLDSTGNEGDPASPEAGND